jgi:hypothetical protein
VFSINGRVTAEINEVAIIHLDLNGYKKGRVFLYIAPISHYNIILGMPWITAQNVRINSLRSELQVGGSAGALVQSKSEFLISDYLICLSVNLRTVIKYSRFLWSV